MASASTCLLTMGIRVCNVISRLQRGLAVSCAGGLTMSSHAALSTPVEADARYTTYHHLERQAAAPCSIVWRTLLDRRQWMESFVSKTILSGLENQVGEVSTVVSRSSTGVNTRLERILNIKPDQHLVWIMWVGSSRAFAVVDLVSRGDRSCSFRLDLFVDALPSAPDQFEIERDAMQSTTDSKINGDFENLKVVAERSAAVARP